MSFIDKASSKLSDSINKIIDKSRQCAQLNRLSAVIRNETDVLNRAYIALGKQYYKTLNGDTETPDMSHICEVIEESKARLKKAQTGYEYIKQNGVTEPKPKQPVIKISADEDIQPEIEQLEEDDDDITIACSHNSDEVADEKAEEPEVSDNAKSADEPKPEEKTVEEVKAETTVVADVIEETETPKKKRSYLKKKTVEPSDSEAANDSDAMPIA